MTRSDDPRVQRSRAAVLRATLDLLCEGGHAAVTIDGVARRSGVARTTIYRHWDGVAELIMDALSSTAAPAADVEAGGDPRRDLRALLGHLRDALCHSEFGPALAATLHAARRDPALAELQQARAAARRAIGRAILARARAEGLVAADADLDLLLDRAVGALYLRYLVTGDPTDDDFLDALAESTLGPVRPGAASP